MALTCGARLGPYEILAPLGQGGMGEVYKARDTRLDRTVAIKILSEAFAADPDRRVRFEREARAVAALNHPHICDLHDVGDAPNPESHTPNPEIVPFLVMEYVEGHTLADRLVRGPLPISDVLRYAIELADALDHAHRRGLVHRDLKPGNVMLTREGAKLLDFGLSRLQSSPNLIALSTISPGGVPLTAEGAVLGTYPYMAPEQLAGRDADARSDIFAFGAMVYEMATGRRAFEGETAATVIGAILHTDPPPLSSLQPLTPPALDRIVARCLAKDPDDRWQTARDLLLELKWIAEHEAPPATDRTRRESKKLALVASAALAILAIAAAAFTVAYVRRVPVEDLAVRLTFSPPKELKLAEARFGGPVTVSPDGRRLAYVATGPDGRQLLWVQPIDSFAAQALPATDGAAYPFWSPDSRSVGFFAQGRLKKIDATSGPPQTLGDVVLPRGGTWGRAGEIVFSAGAGRELYRISAGGGVAMPVPADGVNDERHWPSFLPDGRHFLYFGRRQVPGIYMASLESGDTKLLAGGLYMGAAYASPGYLLVIKGGAMAGTLLAQPFDASRLEVTSEAVPLAERVPFYPFYARGDFSVSENGTLIYGTFRGETTQLAWFDRGGRPLASVPGAGGYGRPFLSPDEKTIAAERLDPETQSQDVWLIETTRGVTSRLTTNPGHDGMGEWSPDGSRIIFGSTREDSGSTHYVKELSGGGSEEVLFGPSLDLMQQVTDWSRDGRFIVYARLEPKTKWDLWVVPATPDPASGDRKPVPYLQTEFNEHQGRLSPDGRWMAYTSDESGRPEVYVRAFPVPSARSQVSTDGGGEPHWRRDGKELFYRSADRMLMAVTVKGDTSFTASAPQALFKMPIADRAVSMATFQNERKYVPTGDGQRFLINVDLEESAPPPVTVVLNWPAALSRR